MLWVVFLLVAGAAATAPGRGAHIVRTSGGLVRGTEELSRSSRSFLGFRGIPYAEPPVGSLRFSLPVPAKRWSGVRNSTPGTSCMSYNIFVLDPNLRLSPGDEDCLYLNVFTPRVGRKQNLPVMVFIHGGGFSSGSGDIYNPQYLMDKDIVLVTINYRLGALGFLTTEDEVIPANLGLKDQVLALAWVRDNIQAFGGDRTSVTIFGESAGAASVHLHMMSPLSTFLFKQGIAHSGSAQAPWALVPPGLSHERAFKSAKILGCRCHTSEDVRQCLSSKTAMELTLLPYNFTDWSVDPVMVFGPSIEQPCPDAFLTNDPFHIPTYKPLLTGVNSDEGVVRTAAFRANGEIKELIENFDTLGPLSLLYDNTASQPDAITNIISNFYLKTKTYENSSISNDIMKGISDIYSDSYFTVPLAEAVQRHKGPLYQYLFDYLGTTTIIDGYGPRLSSGAAHVDDLLYFFNLTALLPFHRMSKKDTKLSENLITLWTNFAYYGDPTPGGSNIIWEPYGLEEKYLHITKDGLTMKSNLFSERINFWRQLNHRDAIFSHTYEYDDKYTYFY